MKIINIILLGLTLFLTSSPFFLSSYFHHKIFIGQTRNFAIDQRTQSLVLSAYHKHKAEQELGSKFWLIASKEIAKVDAKVALELAQYYQQQQQELSAITWYQQAIRLNAITAKSALANILINKGEMLKAFNLVKGAQDNQSMLSAVRAALVLGNIDYIAKIYPKLAHFKEGRALQTNLIKFNVLDFNALDFNLISSNGSKGDGKGKLQSSCQLLIQPYATNLADLFAFEKLLVEFDNTKSVLPFCFAQVNYIPKNKLACDHKTNEAIKCNPLYFAKKNSQLEARYLAVLLPEGGANVNLGIMYLDRHDNLQVFKHELSHLLGFVDEYPLPKMHAKCGVNQQEKFSHNIAVLNSYYQGKRNKEKYYEGKRKALREVLLKQIPWAEFILPTTPILTKQGSANQELTKSVEYWQLGTPERYADEVGVFPAKTCSNQSTTAFKALKRTTLLEYFEAPFPTLYKKIIQANAEQFLMPSFHYSVAQSYFEQGDYQLAKDWLKKSAKLESNPIRVQKILTGSF